MMKHTDDINAFNTSLAKCLQGLKKSAKATTVRQCYHGTGSRRHHRQFFIRFQDGWSADFRVNGQMLIVGMTGIGIDFGGRTPEKVVEVLVEMLNRRSHACAPKPLL